MSVKYVQVHNEKGRIVIPQDIREKLSIVSGTLLEIKIEPTVEETKITITKVK